MTRRPPLILLLLFTGMSSFTPLQIRAIEPSTFITALPQAAQLAQTWSPQIFRAMGSTGTGLLKSVRQYLIFSACHGDCSNRPSAHHSDFLIPESRIWAKDCWPPANWSCSCSYCQYASSVWARSIKQCGGREKLFSREKKFFPSPTPPTLFKKSGDILLPLVAEQLRRWAHIGAAPINMICKIVRSNRHDDRGMITRKRQAT